MKQNLGIHVDEKLKVQTYLICLNNSTKEHKHADILDIILT